MKAGINWENQDLLENRCFGDIDRIFCKEDVGFRLENHGGCVQGNSSDVILENRADIGYIMEEVTNGGRMDFGGIIRYVVDNLAKFEGF